MLKIARAFSVSTLLMMFFIQIAFCQLPLLYDPSLTSEGEYWDFDSWLFGNGYAYAEWQNGTAYLNVSNPLGDGWVGCKLQQGSLPHGWNQAHPLRETIVIDKNVKVYLKVTFRLGNYTFLAYPTNSNDTYAWFNFGISLWLQRENTDWNSAEPQIEIGNKIVWFIYDGKNITHPYNPIYFQGDVGNDYHSLYDVYDESFDNHDWQTVNVEITPHIRDALNHWGEQSGILKNVDVYLETIGAQGEIWVSDVEIAYIQSTPNYKQLMLAFASLLLIALCIAIFKIGSR